MSRKGKSIDQIEQDETFIFREKDAKDGAPEKQDKRTATKEFIVERNQFGHCVIKYTAGGEVPKMLKGSWTSVQRAYEAIDNYVVTRAQQQQGGAASSSSGS